MMNLSEEFVSLSKIHRRLTASQEEGLAATQSCRNPDLGLLAPSRPARPSCARLSAARAERSGP